MTRTNALNTGRDDFLSWATGERGVALPARLTDAVLTMLALRGADRRAGVPEPTPASIPIPTATPPAPAAASASDQPAAVPPATVS